MEELIQLQKNALKALCERLNANNVAAKSDTSSEGMILTLFLPGMPEDKELFTDIFFLLQDERMENISYCCMRTEIRELDGIKEEDILGYCRRISELNNILPIGGYGIELAENGIHPKRLLHTVTIPIVPEIRGEKLTDVLEDTLSLTAQAIADTIADL